ncbi:Gfo/Idh/MocA family oxidoreductase [Schnuerera sp. xch1]|uniref:Gfo/Idh/MocA family protein n=1 Tax=Schnuerera sp. xch1 TaxID=2874283 RepID=UPI001CBD3C53|nr:Gfo/Idh/MocA family oxidoreductase [Schnuerera sp. xch1]MBZ2174081.1 Gfo/Idh/MocA family oxidoreductase [Schnuerera sp. xch1]
MKELKFAIIGCGRISHKHIEALADNVEKSRLVAVCDIVPEKMDKVVEEYHELIDKQANNMNEDVKEVKKYTEYNEMLKKEDIDVVAIATESGYHAKHTIDCLNCGKHVLVEKPMALSIEDVDEMIKIAKEKGLKLGVCHQNRFNPPIQKLRRAIDEGRFGKIVNGTARILWNRNDDYYKQASWRGTKALDGGTLMNQCIHNIDLLQWMMGSEVERIHAERDTFLRNIEMEDFGAILIRFKNGSIGIVEGSACVYPKNLEETLSIFGEKGTVVIGGLAVNEIETWKFADEKEYDKEDVSSQVDSVYGKGHKPLYKDFIDAINNDRDPYISGEEGKKPVEIILRAYEF